MFKKIITALLVCSCFFSNSQTIVNTIPLDLKKDRDVFQIVNDNTKETSLFLSDKKKVKVIRLDATMKIIDSLSIERPNPKKYHQMIGYNGDKSNPSLFWASSNYEEIYTQHYNFQNHTVSGQPFSLPFKDERILQNFTQNNKFYILTVLKKSNTLKLYVFDNEGKLEEKTMDLSGFKFFNSAYIRTTLYGVLEENLLPFEKPFTLYKIITENPISLTDSAKKRKCYSNDKQITLTFDTNFDYTQVITIDLQTFSTLEKVVTQPFLPYEKRYNLTSNSFLMDDKLFQMKLSLDKMYVTIKDLNNTIIKEYIVDANQEITFKNSEILQENGSFDNNRVLDKTSQFLRKVCNSNGGVSCYKVGDNYLITLGSVSENLSSSPAIYGGMFGVSGFLIASAFSNPTYESFNSYASRKVIYVNCLFDKNGFHVNDQLKPLAFDSIRAFLDQQKNISSQTLYKIDKTYYLGYYDNNDKNYVLRKFEE